MREISKYVFIVTKFPDLAGGATYVENMGRGLLEAGYDVEVITMYPGKGYSDLRTFALYSNEALHSKPLSLGISGNIQKLKLIPKLLYKKINRLYSNFRMARRLSKYDEHTVIIFTHIKTLMMLKSAGFNPKMSKSLLIGQQHSPYSSLQYETWLKEALPSHFSDMDVFTCLSDEDAEEFRKLIEIPSFGIPNPASSSTVVAPNAIEDRPFKAALLARFSPEKRIDLAIDLFLQAREQAKAFSWTLEIYGDGELSGDLSRLVESCSDPSAVKIMGRTSDAFETFNQTRINLVTSLYEGFGMTVLESAQVGTPTIALGVSPGLNKLVMDLGGILITSNSYNSFISNLAEFMQDSDFQKKLSKKVIDNSDNYSPKNIISRWEKMIASVQ